jgi:hypothetical protein
MRFAYFIYPLALYAIALSLLELTKSVLSRCPARADLIAGCLSLVLFAMSSDFNPRHLIGVTQPDASFQIGRFEGREAIWYPRHDYASPAEFLGAKVVADLQIPIIVVELPPVSHYLDLDRAVFYPRREALFDSVSRERGTREIWSQRRLLSTDEDLLEFTASSEAFWLVRLVDTERHPFRVVDVWKRRPIRLNRKFLSRDGRIEVVYVTLQPANAPQ